MPVHDYRIGNLILSDYAFGLNSQQFELLTANNEGLKFVYTIDQYPRNLIKAKVEAEDVVDSTTDPENPVTLTEFPFDLSFANILEGAEGIIIVDNSTSATKLKFQPTIPISLNSNISIRENGSTILRFIYENDLFYWESDYKPVSVNFKKQIELEIDNQSPAIPSLRFTSQKECMKYILENAGLQVYDDMFSRDSGGSSVKIYVQPRTYEESFYVPRAGNIGVEFIGIIDSETGKKPIFDATGIANQFSRCVNIYESRNITLKNLHFKRDDGGSSLLLSTRNSSATLIDCTLENGGIEPQDRKNIIQAAVGGSVRIAGDLKIISASGTEKILFSSTDQSSLIFDNIIHTPTGNANGGMSVFTNQIVNFEIAFKASRYSKIEIGGYIDGGSDNERYISGSITYDTYSNIQTGAELENKSTKFPG